MYLDDRCIITIWPCFVSFVWQADSPESLTSCLLCHSITAPHSYVHQQALHVCHAHKTEMQVKWFVSCRVSAVCCQLSECLIAPVEYVWRNWLCCMRVKLIMKYGWISLSVMKFCWVNSARITLFTKLEGPWVFFPSVFEFCNYFIICTTSIL